MKAGTLRDRISLESIHGTGDGAWTEYATAPADLWAAVEPRGGDGSYTVRIRYRSDLRHKRDIGAGLSVIFGPQRLNVLDITEVERRKEVHLTCREAVIDVDTLSTGAHGVAVQEA